MVVENAVVHRHDYFQLMMDDLFVVVQWDLMTYIQKQIVLEYDRHLRKRINEKKTNMNRSNLIEEVLHQYKIVKIDLDVFDVL